jgi:hypothetical protein
MNVAPILYAAIMSLQKSMNGMLSGTQIDQISEKIKRFAIASAVTTGISCTAPGAGAAIAVVAQTGLVWTLYVQINKTLGISIKENMLKFIGSAVLTNLINNFGSYIASYVLAGVASLFIGVGTAVAFLIGAAIGYVCIYTAAVIYLKLLTKFVGGDGSVKINDEKAAKDAVDDVFGNTDVKSAIEEAQSAFKDARRNGELRDARRYPKCPACGKPITHEQKFCSNCGSNLK